MFFLGESSLPSYDDDDFQHCFSDICNDYSDASFDDDDDEDDDDDDENEDSIVSETDTDTGKFKLYY